MQRMTRRQLVRAGLGSTGARVLGVAAAVLLTAALIVVPLGRAVPPTTRRASAAGHVSLGFDVATDLATTTPWSDLTEDSLFAVQTTAGSALDTASQGVNTVNVPQWVAAAHAHGVLALFTIGGIADQNWQYACSDTYRSAFVANLVSYMQANGFDGIDIDIEDDAWAAQNPPVAAWDTCVQAIANAAHATTTAAGNRPLISEDVTTPWMGSYVANDVPSIDQWNLMTYGENPTQMASDVQATINEGVTDSSTFLVGIDLVDYPSTTPQDCYNDAQYAAQNGLAGALVWDIHEDAALHTGTSPCFDNVAQALGIGGGNPTPTPTPTAAATSTPTPTPSGSTPHWVQGGYVSPTAGTTATVTLSSVTAGDVLVATVCSGAGGVESGTPSSTGPAALTWTKLLQYANPSGSDQITLWSAPVATAGAYTVTATVQTEPSLAVDEYAGIAGTLAASGTASGSGTAPSATTSVAAPANALVLGAFAWSSGNPTITAGTGYTLRQGYGNAAQSEPVVVEDAVTAASGTVTANLTLSASVPWTAVIVALT